MKKIIAIIISVITVILTFAFSASAATLKGDVNIDHVTNAADARLALRMSVGLEPHNSQRECYADVDYDGKVTAADARIILRASVGLEEIECIHECDTIDFYNKIATPEENGVDYYNCRFCDYSYEVETVFEPVSDNSLLIPSIMLHETVAITDLSQSAVDNNDIIANYDHWGENDPIICGHVHYVLQNLCKVKVGDTIYFTRDGITEKYVVTRSEEGTLVNGGTNIKGNESGELAMFSSDIPTLHFYTCHGIFGSRWIVIAEKV